MRLLGQWVERGSQQVNSIRFAVAAILFSLFLSPAEFEVDGLLHFVYLATDTQQYTMPAFPGTYEGKKPRKEFVAYGGILTNWQMTS